MFNQLINNIFLQAFSLVKYNLVLFLPFFAFLFIAGFVLFPLRSMSEPPSIMFMFFVIPALFSVFLSGWLNMFKKCTEKSTDENQPDDKRTEDSFLLFKEFFPGVDKYFVKIVMGLLFFNALLLLSDKFFLSFLGNLDSFSYAEFQKYNGDPTAAAKYIEGINHSDKLQLFKIGGLKIFFTLIFSYATMFWIQIAVLYEISPIKAILKSFKTVINTPFLSFIIFIFGISSFSLALLLNTIAMVNPILQLFSLILFVFVIIYFLMLTFVFLQKNSPRL